MIAIIAILAAMLLPTLNQAREKALTSNCLNNLKQVGNGMVFYTADNNDLYPQMADASGVYWSQKFVKDSKYITADVLLCPETKKVMASYYRDLYENKKFTIDDNMWTLANYGINTYEFGYDGWSDTKTSKTKITEVKKNARFIVALESASGDSSTIDATKPYVGSRHYYSNWTYYSIYPRHNNNRSLNVLYGDGHSAAVTGYGTTIQEVASNIYSAGGELKAFTIDDNCWTWDSNARAYTQKGRP